MKIFIASSTESLSYATSAQKIFQEKNLDATIWKDAEFDLSSTIIDSLEKLKSNYDVAVFIFYPDDELNFRGESIKSVRDNVIFEFGLFVGALGINRCFALVPSNLDIKKPSDLLGVIHATYDYISHDENINKTLRVPISEISDAIKKKKNKNTKKNDYLIRGDYRDSIVDVSASIEMLDIQLHEQWVEYIRNAKKIKEELLYWERRTAKKWLEFENYSVKDISHIKRTGDWLKQNLPHNQIDFISLGPGSGKKDIAFISSMADQNSEHWYYPIDISSHLLFHTLKSVTSKFDDTYLKVKGIRANFNYLEKLKYIYQYTGDTNIFMLFGNTLGNYNESELLDIIRMAVFSNDLLIIEVEKINPSFDKYQNSYYQNFILEPLKTLGLNPNKDNLKFEEETSNLSSVKGAYRINANYYLTASDKKIFGTDVINITYSTGYNKDDLKDFFSEIGFDIVYETEDKNHIVIVFKVNDAH